jgi:hypothetical protein
LKELKSKEIQMAVKHINENAKEESGILLSGDDATKVFSMFSKNKSSLYIKEKTNNLKSLLDNALKKPFPSAN